MCIIRMAVSRLSGPLNFLIRDQTVEVINKSSALKLRRTTKDKVIPLAKEPLCAQSASQRSFPKPESLSPRRDVLLRVSSTAIDFFMVNYVSQATCNAEFTSLRRLPASSLQRRS
jgi:hypothetical protein